jgi:hypothetical protein
MRSDRRSRHETIFSINLRAARMDTHAVSYGRLTHPFHNSCIAVYLFLIHFILIRFSMLRVE